MPNLKKTSAVVVSLLFIASPVIAFYERQNMYDWWRLRNYAAPAEVSQLATDTTMDEYARKIFYVAHPQLQNSEDFRANCTTFEKTIVLGCYQAGVGIFVYDVNDPRLNGVMQVTSAHEMLHSAYSRLSSKDRSRIDVLTKQAYDTLTDQRVKSNIDSYRSRDPSVVPNELHSILGTEVRTLPAELETYYKKYFTDRSKIVAYSEQYEAEFTNREKAVADYDAQLAQLKTTIAGLNSALENRGKVLESEDKRLQQLLSQQNIREYNAGVPGYQQQVNLYNADINKLKTAISTYNKIVDLRNGIVTEERELMNAIDSSVPTAK